jgi:hypothetical protein
MPVVVSGVPELKRALKQFAPDLAKEMNDEIRVALKAVTDTAKAKVPPSAPGNLYNWNDKGGEPTTRTSRFRAFPKYDAQLIRKGLTYSLGQQKRNRQGFAGMFSLFNKDAAGSIIELAGRVHPGGRRQKASRNYGESSKDIGQSNNPNAGRIFVGAMNDIGAMKQYDKFQRNRGRLLYAAYAENQGKALDAVMRAIDKAAKALNARTKTNRMAA